mgnify:CR=1 FL=1
MKTALLGVATLVSTATAHVRMVGAESKVGTIPLPIRNAAVVGANGAASVKGPCGGSNTFQTAAAAAAPVPVGGKVSLGLQYAAGHQSPANLFSVTFRCGAPNNNQMRAGEDGTTTLTEAECKTIKGGTKYPVPAPTGRDVKVVECTLPTKTADELTGTGSDCTLSFQDQRKWGGCVDFKYGSNGGAVGGGGGGGGDFTGGASCRRPCGKSSTVSKTCSEAPSASGGSCPAGGGGDRHARGDPAARPRFRRRRSALRSRRRADPDHLPLPAADLPGGAVGRDAEQPGQVLGDGRRPDPAEPDPDRRADARRRDAGDAGPCAGLGCRPVGVWVRGFVVRDRSFLVSGTPVHVSVSQNSLG